MLNILSNKIEIKITILIKVHVVKTHPLAVLSFTEKKAKIPW